MQLQEAVCVGGGEGGTEGPVAVMGTECSYLIPGSEEHQEGLELTPAAPVLTQDPRVPSAVERSDAPCLSWACSVLSIR